MRRARRSSTACCRRWWRACACWACCCTRTFLRAPTSCWVRWARRIARWRARAGTRRRRWARASGSSTRCSPSPREPARPTVIDSHTHLHLCERPTAELVSEAAAAGVTRMLTVGIDGASCRAALAAAEEFPQVYAAIGRHPTAAGGFDDADLAELRALAAHERCVAIGESGLDFYVRDGEAARPCVPGADQRRAFAAQIELARETGKPLVIHTRAAERDTLDQLAE